MKDAACRALAALATLAPLAGLSLLAAWVVAGFEIRSGLIEDAAGATLLVGALLLVLPAGYLLGRWLLLRLLIRIGRETGLARLLCGTLLVAGPLAALVFAATSGAQVSRREDIVILRTVAICIGSLLASLGIEALLSLLRTRPSSTWVRFAGLGLGLAIGSGSAATNIHLYPGQYSFLHLVVSVAGGVALAAAVLAVMPRSRRAIALGLVGSSAIVVIGLGSSSGREAFDGPARVRNLLLRWRGATQSSTDLGDPGLLAGLWGRSQSGRSGELFANRSRPRSVLLITVDALRARNVSHLGYERRTTPFLDRFSEESYTFERAYSQSSHSLASILSMFCGVYPSCLELDDKSARLTTPTLAETLASQGRETWAYPGFLRHDLETKFADFQRGFADFRQIAKAGTTPKADRVLEAALSELRRRRVAGLDLGLGWLHLMELHEHQKRSAGSFGDAGIDRYDDALLEVDAALSRFFSIADAEGLLDDCLVVIHGDHGEEFGEHGGSFHGSTLYEEQIHVGFWIRLPDRRGRRISETVELVDLAPTLLDLIEQPASAAMHGDSLVPLMLGDSFPGFAYSTLQSPGLFSQRLDALIEGDLKLIQSSSSPDVRAFDLAGNPLEGLAEARKAEPDESARLAAAVALAAAAPRGQFELRRPTPGPVADLSTIEGIAIGLASGDRELRRRAQDAAMRAEASQRLALLAPLIRSVPSKSDELERLRELYAELREAPMPALLPALKEALAAWQDSATLSEALLVFSALASADDLPWLASWASSRAPLDRGLALIVAAGLGDEAARAQVERDVAGLGDAVFLFALAVLGAGPASPLRDLILAALLCEPPPTMFAFLGLRVLLEATDPAALAVLRLVEEGSAPMPPFVHTNIIGRLRQQSRDPDAAASLRRLVDRAASVDRLDALDALMQGRSEPPVDVLDGSVQPPRVARDTPQLGDLSRRQRSIVLPPARQRPAIIALSLTATQPPSELAIHAVELCLLSADGEVLHRVAAHLLAEPTGRVVVGAAVSPPASARRVRIHAGQFKAELDLLHLIR